MRSNQMLRALRRVRPDIDGELTSRLLLAAMLQPFAAALFGWPVHTPLGVPVAVHAAILGAITLLALGFVFYEPTERQPHRLALWSTVPLLAVAFALLLNERANVFYTGRALMEGMAALSLVHLAACWLRRRALAPRELSLVTTEASRAISARGWWRSRRSPHGAASTPAVRVADRLTTIVGWSVLASWTLIALEHRHVAGPLLLLAGALECIGLVMLIPDALPHAAALALARAWHASHADSRVRATPLSVVRGGAPARSRTIVPHLRRRS